MLTWFYHFTFMPFSHLALSQLCCSPPVLKGTPVFLSFYVQKGENMKATKVPCLAWRNCKYIKGSFSSVCHYSHLAATECHTWAIGAPTLKIYGQSISYLKLFTLSFVFIFTDVGHLTVWSSFKAFAKTNTFMLLSQENGDGDLFPLPLRVA